MPLAPDVSARPLTLLKVVTAESARPGDLEGEVMALYDEYRSTLLRYVLSLGLSPQDGEEVVQEVFMALFRHLQLGRSRRNLRGWIFCVAHNLGLKQRQRNQRRLLKVEVDSELAEDSLDPAPTPEEQVLASQRQRRLLAVVEALPAQDRNCLRLRAEGLRYREIARVLGMSLGSVAASLARSLARLRCVDER